MCGAALLVGRRTYALTALEKELHSLLLRTREHVPVAASLSTMVKAVGGVGHCHPSSDRNSPQIHKPDAECPGG